MNGYYKHIHIFFIPNQWVIFPSSFIWMVNRIGKRRGLAAPYNLLMDFFSQYPICFFKNDIITHRNVRMLLSSRNSRREIFIEYECNNAGVPSPWAIAHHWAMASSKPVPLSPPPPPGRQAVTVGDHCSNRKPGCLL